MALVASPSVQPVGNEPLGGHQRNVRQPPAVELLILDVSVYGLDVSRIR